MEKVSHFSVSEIKLFFLGLDFFLGIFGFFSSIGLPVLGQLLLHKRCAPFLASHIFNFVCQQRYESVCTTKCVILNLFELSPM